MQPAVGAKVGRFTLVRPIETGDERTMWLGSHEAFGTMQLAAIDLPPEGDPDPARAIALRREAEVAQQLSHEGVQRVLEVGEIEGRSFIAREYVEGITLARLQAPLETLRSTDDPLRLACIVHIVGAVLDVLAHTHAIQTVPGLPAGVIHGQLTAQDVLVSTHGKIKIAGFGLDRRPQDGTAGLMSHDALRCMPPEQLHRSNMTPGVDTYGVGILLHTLLDGQPPWPELGGADLYRAILSAAPPQVQQPSPAELEALRAALVALAGQRIVSAEAAAQMLRQWPSPKPDVSVEVGQLVRRVLAPTPSQDPFDLASQTSSALRPMSLPPSSLAGPSIHGSPSAPGPAPATPAAPGPAFVSSPPSVAGAPRAGPAFASTPPEAASGAAAPPQGPAFVPPPGPASPSSGPPFVPSPPQSPPGQAFVSPPSSSPEQPAGPAGFSPAPGIAPPSASSAVAAARPPSGSAEGDGTAMIDPEMLARMREEARQASRAAPGSPVASTPVVGGAASMPSGAAAAPHGVAPKPASARPEAASGVVGVSVGPAGPAQPAFVGSTGAAHRPASVVVSTPSSAPKRPAAPPTSASAIPRLAAAPRPAAPKPSAPVFEPAADVGEGTTTAMLVRREKRSLALILVGGALVSILLGVVVAYLVFI